MTNYLRRDCKIKFNDASQQFFINPDQRIVVCKLTGTLMGPESNRWYLNPNFEPRNLTSIGKAVCSPNDKFDVNIGKKIALAKAESAIYNKACKVIANEMNVCADYIEMLRTFFLKADDVIEHNLDYIDRLSD